LVVHVVNDILHNS